MARKLPKVSTEIANPGGTMPQSVADTITYARSKSKQLCRVLYEIATDECNSTKDRVKAAEVLLDRGLGKAPVVNYTFTQNRGDNRAEVMELAREVLSMVNPDVAQIPSKTSESEVVEEDEPG